MNKRVALFGILIVLTLALAGAAMAGAPPSQWDTTQDVTVDFIYDGFCDGANITLDTSEGIVTGVYTSSCATCPFGTPLIGTGGSLVGQGTAANWYIVGFGTSTVLRADGTWSHYDDLGSNYNNGTWTSCVQAAPVPAGAPASTAR